MLATPIYKNGRWKWFFGTLERKLIIYWKHYINRAKMIGIPIETWDALKENLRYHYPKPHEMGYRRIKDTFQNKKQDSSKRILEVPSNQNERRKTERSKGGNDGNSRAEKWENVWSEVSELPQRPYNIIAYPSLCENCCVGMSFENGEYKLPTKNLQLRIMWILWPIGSNGLTCMKIWEWKLRFKVKKHPSCDPPGTIAKHDTFKIYN